MIYARAFIQFNVTQLLTDAYVDKCINLRHVLCLTLRAQIMTRVSVSLTVAATPNRNVFLLTLSVMDTLTVQTAKTKGHRAWYVTNIFTRPNWSITLFE